MNRVSTRLLGPLLVGSFLVAGCTLRRPPLTASGSSGSCVAPSATAAASEPVRARDYGLTISGGISVGAYEAGVNWALVAGMRAYADGKQGTSLRPFLPRLRSVTGASAGAINTILTAATYCGKSVGTVAHNVLHRSWAKVGWQQLFPGRLTCAQFKERFPVEEQAFLDCEGSSAYRSDDGLLTRQGLGVVEGLLKKDLEKTGAYDPACSLELGITLTSVDAKTITQSGLEVPTQRLAVLMRAKGTPTGELVIEQAAPPQPSGAVGYVAWLAAAGTPLPAPTLFGAMEAASAFPVAFGLKKLTLCDGTGKNCTDERSFDGGLYDNVPVGLAIELAARAQTTTAQAPQPGAVDPAPPSASPPATKFLFVDPERLRRIGDVHKVSTKDGLPMLVQLLGTFVSVARKYELQTTARTQTSSTIAPVSRLIPIMGEHFAWFGAFPARPFRQIDYYVGLYDGLRALAADACEGSDESCVATQVLALHDAIGLAEEPKDPVDLVVTRSASNVVKTLVVYEAGMNQAVTDSVCKPQADPVTTALLKETLRLDKERRENKDHELPDDAFFRVTHAAAPEIAKVPLEHAERTLGYPLLHDEQEFFADGEGWLAAQAKMLALRGFDREERIAKEQGDSGFLSGPTAYGAIAFGAHLAWPHGYYVNARSLPLVGDLPPGDRSGPVFARLLPYELSQQLNLGFEFGWRAGYQGSTWGAGLVARLGRKDDFWYGRFAILGSFRFLDLGLTFRAPGSVVPTPLADKQQGTSSFGPELGVSVLRFLRLSLTFEDLLDVRGRFANEGQRSVHLRISLNDVGSLVYWGARIL